MVFTKPRKLRAGDTIAVVSPSWGGPSVFPQIYECGLQVLQDRFGLRIKEYPTARADATWLYHHPQARADDINAAFADPDARAIMASIGGDDSVRILPYLDPAVIQANPKILMGFSDTTTLLTYCNQLGLVTLNGPSIMAGFAQIGSLPPAFAEHLTTMLFESPSSYSYAPYAVWSEGYPDWGDSDSLGQVKQQHPNSDGWHWLQGETTAQGRLYGGCIDVLEFMKGTRFWPSIDFWRDTILFVETSEEAPTPDQVKYMLRNYGSQGIYERLNALLVGRPHGYTAAHKQRLDEILVSVIATEFGRPELLIVSNMDFGHTDPQWIMPLGVQAQLDPTQKSFKLLESPLS